MASIIDNAPKVIHWQAEDLYLYETKIFGAEKQTSNLNGMIRYSFANAANEVKLMQFQFPNNPPIDWQALEAENAEKAIDSRPIVLRIKAIRNRDYKALKKRIMIQKLVSLRSPKGSPKYDAFIAEMQSWEDSNG